MKLCCFYLLGWGERGCNMGSTEFLWHAGVRGHLTDLIAYLQVQLTED